MVTCYVIVVNIDNKVGAVGFTSVIVPTAYPITLIKVNKDTGEPIRDSNGVCIKCKPGTQILITILYLILSYYFPCCIHKLKVSFEFCNSKHVCCFCRAVNLLMKSYCSGYFFQFKDNIFVMRLCTL